jgi:peptidoglycan/LPS O-acetylase OafA/YrhL
MAGLGVLAIAIPSQVFVFSFIFLFLIGVVICQLKVGMIGKTQCAVLLIVLTVVTYFANGIPTLIAGSIAAYAILFLSFKNAAFSFLGNISYSLYLLHSPIGRRAMNVAIRVIHPESQTAKLAVVAIAVAASIGAAYVLYRLVEKPAQDWSASFQYKHRRRRQEEISPEEMQQLNPAL